MCSWQRSLPLPEEVLVALFRRYVQMQLLDHDCTRVTVLCVVLSAVLLLLLLLLSCVCSVGISNWEGFAAFWAPNGATKAKANLLTSWQKSQFPLPNIFALCSAHICTGTHTYIRAQF